MIRNRPIFLCLNQLEAKLIAKVLRYTTSHARAEIGFTEYQMFNELTIRMQAIARGQEKEGLNDFMSTSIRPGMDDDDIV
jgi:hypothetical protein